MVQAITIFLAGVSGVFIGMGLLYIAILILPVITRRFDLPKEKK